MTPLGRSYPINLDSRSIVARSNSKGRLGYPLPDPERVWRRRQRFLDTTPGRQPDFVVPFSVPSTGVSHIPSTSLGTPSSPPYQSLETTSYSGSPLIDLSQGPISFDHLGRLDTPFYHKAPLGKRELLTPMQSPPSSTSSPQVVVIPTLQVFIHQLTQPAVQTPVQPQRKNPNPHMAGPTPPNPWLAARFKPLFLPPADQLGDLPDWYLKVLPKLNGENGITAEDNFTTFQDCPDNFDVEEDDVFSRMFAHSLEGEARKWFRNLPNNSITYWGQLHEKFLKRWGVKKDNRDSLT